MSKTTTEMQLISIDKLVPYVNNARTHSAEQIIKLRSSLREFGFVNPIIIDRDFNVIAGHGRLMAAKDVVSRLQEDETRRENPALIALTNKMLQDPNMAVRSLSLAALESNIVAGDNFTTKLLTNMSKVKNSEEADIATKVLLRMPQ